MNNPLWILSVAIGSMIIGMVGAILTIVTTVMYVRTLTKTLHAALLHGTFNYFWITLSVQLVTVLSTILLLRVTLTVPVTLEGTVISSLICLGIMATISIIELAWMERDWWAFKNSCSATLWLQRWKPFSKGFRTLYQVERDL